MKQPVIRLALATATLLFATAAGASDLAEIYLFKAAWYEQNSAGDPVLIPATYDPYDLTATAYLSDEILSDPDWEMWLAGMTMKTPGGLTQGMDLNAGAGAFTFYEGAASASFLDNRYTAGTYQFTLNSVITGATRYNVPLAVTDYPPAPKVLNYTAAQNVDPVRDFTLRWTNFPAGGEREIWLQITASETGELVFAPPALAGEATSVVIPAGTLAAGTRYDAQLTFTRYTHADAAGSPATFSGFESYNTVRLVAGNGGGTIDPPVISGVRLLANGDLELTVTCTAGRVLVLQGEPVLGGNWSTLQSTTPAASPATLVVPKANLVPQRFLRVYQE